ncbi:hypothetical protein BGZ61DRAFT_500629 [Ilyonectria robusta]|uniref:uncharacterized protein n=1 Tax=Ilyonectria robusta TaxID=1079257 RepID=UPI001E8EAF27|nr:uncharacterized protein BGZ61DRAFT_500629 [Ilyonectria robusta]KAH8654271.1 hypothetical protein BGZ61DRAFT_500629 [Ilyonectria robusta]
MIIDYSKWDNIDTDLELEISPPLVPTPQAPIPAAPQSGIPATTAPSAIIIKADHPIFSNHVPPVPGLIEIPLVLHRIGTQSTNRADLDNQIATYLNIDSESGFAPSAWQSYVGTVLVARKDEKLLLPQHLERVWMYCDYILDVFGEGESTPTNLYSLSSQIPVVVMDDTKGMGFPGPESLQYR